MNHLLCFDRGPDSTTMPFWGLLITSSTFLLPAWFAKKRKKKVLAVACRILTATSVWFHSTVMNNISFVIDRTFAHGFAVYFGARSIAQSLQKKSIPHILMCSSMLVPITIYMVKVKRTEGLESQLWHMAFHITGQTCIMIYAKFF